MIRSPKLFFGSLRLGPRRHNQARGWASSNGNARKPNPYIDLPSNAVLCCPSRCTIGAPGWRTAGIDPEPNQEKVVGEPPTGASSSVKPVEDRLDSWKEIAAYLNRDVTTVQRWEKREGMPVHRHLHDSVGSVYASRAELDQWVRSRNLREAPENAGDVASSSKLPTPPDTRIAASKPGWMLLFRLAAIGIVAIGVGLWLQRSEYFWRSRSPRLGFSPLRTLKGSRRPPPFPVTVTSSRFSPTAMDRRTSGSPKWVPASSTT